MIVTPGTVDVNRQSASEVDLVSTLGGTIDDHRSLTRNSVWRRPPEAIVAGYFELVACYDTSQMAVSGL